MGTKLHISKWRAVRQVLQKFSNCCTLHAIWWQISWSYWATKAMAENDVEGMDQGNPVDSVLQDHIADLAEVLDRWVKGIDTRLGRNGSRPELAGPDGDAEPLDGGASEPFAGEINADGGEL